MPVRAIIGLCANMAFPQRGLLRNFLKSDISNLLSKPQRRWARVHDVRFVATQPSSDKVFDKYKDKLDRKAREIGVKNADELKRLFKEKSHTSSSAPAATPPPFTVPPAPSSPQAAAAPHSATPPRPSSTPPGVKTLSSFIDVPKFLDLPEKEITTLWRLRHASSPRSLCAVIPYHVYHKIKATARRHPQFILPLARHANPADDAPQEVESGGGADIHFLQWTFPTPDSATVLFTHLAEYKLRGEYSVPHTTIQHHLELARDKGLVLLQGQVADDRGVSVENARGLLLTLQKFYAIEDERPERGKLLEQFSRGDRDFKVESLVEEAEKIW